MGKRGAPLPALLTGAALVAALLFWPRRASAATQIPFDQWDAYPLPSLDPLPIPDVGYMPTNADQNLRAFLRLIRVAEHNVRQADNGAAYGMFYGSVPFFDFSDHPVITGERRGAPLSDAMCRAAGFSPGCVTTAAGAYQIIKPTWQRVRKAGAWGERLPDFGPASQDEAARRLLIESRALPLIEAGDIQGGIKRAAGLWASLPGNTAGQRQLSEVAALSIFDDGLTAWG